MRDAPKDIIPRFASALSVRTESASAAKEATERALSRLGEGAPDLALLFITAPHAPQAALMASLIQQVSGARHVVTCSARGVIGEGIEIEETPGASLMLAAIPGVKVSPFRVDELPKVPDKPSPDWHKDTFAEALYVERDHAGTLLFCDPYSVPLVRALPAISIASRAMPVLGGFASSAKQPGQNAIGLNDDIRDSGGVGLSLSGDLHIEGVVSQGCKPIGPTMVVTKARDNIIQQLGGKRAVDMLKEVVSQLPASERVALAKGMLLGKVINEYRDRFGQGDFLIRGVHSIDATTGAIVANDFFRVGQTVQIHIRDAQTAHADLDMLLDAQKLKARPEAGLVFSCVSRGKKFFREPHHDAAVISRAFSPTQAGVQQAKSGQHIDVSTSHTPLAGFFADGEFGPVGDQSYLHTMTTSLGLLRSPKLVD